MKGYFYTILSLFLLASCASVSSPPGGEKDTQAPLTVNSSPELGSTNITENKIQIKFDEFVTLQSPNQEININPYLEEKAKFKIKGKSVIVELPEPLLPNTTYSIDFGNAIKDFNEGNILLENQFYFSTGNEIDSAYIKGIATNVLDGKSEAKMRANLYPVMDDIFNLNEEAPIYTTLTDESGHFNFFGLKEGEYWLLVFKDSDSDKKFNVFKDEMIGFSSDKVSTSDSSVYQIKYFSIDQENVVLSQKWINEQCLAIEFKNPLKNTNFQWNDENAAQNTTLSYNENKNNLIICKSNNYNVEDSLLVQFKSVENYIKIQNQSDNAEYDTISTIKIVQKNGPKENSSKLSKFSKTETETDSVPQIIDSIKVLPNQKSILRFNNPIIKLSLDKILLLDENQNPISIKTEIHATDKFQVEFMANYTFGKKYELMFLPNLLTDFFGQTNEDTIRRILRTYSEDEVASFSITINDLNADKNYILKIEDGQNLNENIEEIIQNKTSVTFKYKNIIPTQFSTVLTEDDNGNNIWDNGDFINALQPERIIIGPTIKADADIETEIEFNLSGITKGKE